MVDYTFTDEDVLFLFNPFDAHVLNIVVERIALFLAERKAPIWILYRNRVHDEVFEGRPEFSLLRKFVYLGSDFSVYRSGIEPAHRHL